ARCLARLRPRQHARDDPRRDRARSRAALLLGRSVPRRDGALTMLDRVVSPLTTSREPVAPPRRLQRLRRTASLRDLVAETGFTQSQLIQPLFIVEDPAGAGAIPGLPG